MHSTAVAELPREAVLAHLRAQVDALEGRGRPPLRLVQDCAPEIAPPPRHGPVLARGRDIPVHPTLAALLPDGRLKPGAAYCVTSVTLLLTLLTPASREGLWCGLVGVPDLGAEAAALAGVRIDRFALVPDPGAQWLSVVAALGGAMPLVAVRPPGQVTLNDANRLASRLRERQTVLLSLGPWPGAEATIMLDETRWVGLGLGWGRLTAREANLQVTSKRFAGARSARVRLPELIPIFPADGNVVDDVELRMAV